MIRRRALFAGVAALLATRAEAQYRPTGSKHRLVTFAGAGEARLDGTLLLPTVSEVQYVPGVVLIAGSGPTDRDGNNRLVPARIDSLKQIAERLARAGIASLRYDKRGIGASAPSPRELGEQERFFAWENFIGDVRAAHRELLKHDEIKPYATALLGHSEGGALALAAASSIRERRPHAVVLAATPGLKLGEIIRRQLTRTAPQFVGEAERVMADILRTGHTPVGVPAELAALFPAYIGPFLQGALEFDPARALAAIDAPCLLVHGGADSQIVPMGDIQPLIDALAQRPAGGGEALVAPGISHNLKTVTWPGDPGFAGPLAPAIGDKIASWLAFVLGA